MNKEELAVEVARKIWDWIPDGQGGYAYSIDDSNKLKDWEDKGLELSAYVFSWEGFGRTVEAMEGKGYFFEFDGITMAFWKTVGQKGEEKNFEPISVKGEFMVDELNDSQSKWEATHRAALEAVDALKDKE